ncbi:histidinol dehydrogenase [Akkermansiaceae bacterium]|nr:histidinol dehydrogenase [Akkermansiaceae bacterium]MDB4615344.1 histidinol dehydrogenase [Akkermansiaceae bacterium]
MKVLSHSDSGYERFVKKLNRRAIPTDDVRESVSAIIADVAKRGDAALVDFAKKFDGATLKKSQLRVSDAELAAARAQVSPATKAAVAASRKNIHAFAKRSLRKDWSYKNAEGAEVGERFVPFDRVGIYVPGGKAPLVSTALMTGAFAQAAGVPEIVAATPPGADGSVNPDLLYALSEAGATEIYKMGGAHGIAALSLGTKTIGPVNKVFGPGNKFVVEAKRQMVGAVSIDLLPGPSEVLIAADATANPRFLAADLLAQAEHGPDSVVGFVTTSKKLLADTQVEVAKQLADLPRKDIAKAAFKKAGFMLLVKSMKEAIAIVNDWAPEHLVLVAKDEDKWLDQVRTAGAIYVGNYSAVAVGDFLAGPSHTLPTEGSGRSFSGLRADQFQRRASVVRMDQKALRKSQKHVEHFAAMEGLFGHGNSVTLRAED